MTAAELKSRYGIKLPHEIGKPLYIQDVDVKKAFINSLPIKIVALIFFLIIARIVVLASYGSFVNEGRDYDFSTIFSYNTKKCH